MPFPIGNEGVIAFRDSVFGSKECCLLSKACRFILEVSYGFNGDNIFHRVVFARICWVFGSGRVCDVVFSRNAVSVCHCFTFHCWWAVTEIPYTFVYHIVITSWNCLLIVWEHESHRFVGLWYEEVWCCLRQNLNLLCGNVFARVVCVFCCYWICYGVFTRRFVVMCHHFAFHCWRAVTEVPYTSCYSVIVTFRGGLFFSKENGSVARATGCIFKICNSVWQYLNVYCHRLAGLLTHSDSTRIRTAMFHCHVWNDRLLFIRGEPVRSCPWINSVTNILCW